jgi:tyrosyl-tRNA synthetase
MKILTLMSIEDIDNIVSEHQKDPGARFGQKKLAEYIVELIFGKEEMSHVNKITEILFSNKNKLDLIKKLNNKEIFALKSATGGIEMDDMND